MYKDLWTPFVYFKLGKLFGAFGMVAFKRKKKKNRKQKDFKFLVLRETRTLTLPRQRQTPCHCATRPKLSSWRVIFVYKTLSSVFDYLATVAQRFQQFNDFIPSEKNMRMSTKHPQTFLHRIFSFHLARNSCWLGTVLDDISICFNLSTRRFSHQIKNVPTLSTPVECSLGYFF